MWLMPDVSHWQGHHTREDMVQVSTVAASIMFKASQGTSFVDDEFVSNAEAANGAALPWGAYHFVDPGDVEQAARWGPRKWRASASKGVFSRDGHAWTRRRAERKALVYMRRIEERKHWEQERREVFHRGRQ